MLVTTSNQGRLVAIHRKAIARALDGDQLWFAQRPWRALRLRKLMPYEFNGPLGPLRDGLTWRVLVERERTGSEVRIPIWVPVLLPEEGADDCHLTEWLKLISTKTYDKAARASEDLRNLI